MRRKLANWLPVRSFIASKHESPKTKVTHLLKVVGGSSLHCCVPLCSASSRYNTALSFHRFPKDADLRAQWVSKVKRVGFEVTPGTRVCSRHFESGQVVTSAKGKRHLVPNTVPTLFQWNGYSKRSRPGIWERCPRPVRSESEEGAEAEADTASQADTTSALASEAAVPMVVDHDYAASSSVVVDRLKYDNMVREIEELRQQLQSQHISSFGLERFAGSPEDIRFYTRYINKHITCITMYSNV